MTNGKNDINFGWCWKFEGLVKKNNNHKTKVDNINDMVLYKAKPRINLFDSFWTILTSCGHSVEIQSKNAYACILYACVFVCIGLSANNDYSHYQVISVKTAESALSTVQQSKTPKLFIYNHKL